MERVHGDRARKSGASTGGASQKGKNFELKRLNEQSQRLMEHLSSAVRVAQVNESNIKNTRECVQTEVDVEKLICSAQDILSLVHDLKTNAVTCDFEESSSAAELERQQCDQQIASQEAALKRIGVEMDHLLQRISDELSR